MGQKWDQIPIFHSPIFPIVRRSKIVPTIPSVQMSWCCCLSAVPQQVAHEMGSGSSTVTTQRSKGETIAWSLVVRAVDPRTKVTPDSPAQALHTTAGQATPAFPQRAKRPEASGPGVRFPHRWGAGPQSSRPPNTAMGSSACRRHLLEAYLCSQCPPWRLGWMCPGRRLMSWPDEWVPATCSTCSSSFPHFAHPL